MNTLALQVMTLSELHAVAAGQVPVVPGLTLADGAVAPPFVAERALRQRDEGQPSSWTVPFHIVDTRDRLVVGGCGFKGMPQEGRVEIGYAIAPGYRRRGIATFAVGALLRLAADSGQVREVLARIDRDNAGSTRIAQQLGFVESGMTRENTDDVIVQWLHHFPAASVR